MKVPMLQIIFLFFYLVKSLQTFDNYKLYQIMAKVRMRLYKFTFAVKNCQSSTVIKQRKSGITFIYRQTDK